jgi:hypothetical protein
VSSALWLGQVIEMPTVLTRASYPLAGFTARLAITWWAEQANVCINGQLVQQSDLFFYFCGCGEMVKTANVKRYLNGQRIPKISGLTLLF